MPALPSVPSVVKLQHLMSIDALYTAMVHLYVKYTGSAPSGTDLNNLAGAIGGSWASTCAQLAPLTTILTEVTAVDLTSPSAGAGASQFTHAGTRTGQALTANDCYLFELLIARRYRGGKPRQYWPFGVVTDIANPQNWTTTFHTLAQTQLQNYQGSIVGLSWPGGQISNLVNVSYYSGFQVVTDPITGRARNVPKLRSSPVVDNATGTRGSIRVATQRRRQNF